MLILSISLFGIHQLSTQFLLYEDRLVKRNIFGERCLFRNDIENVEIRHFWRQPKIAYLIPKASHVKEMALPAYLIEFDSKFHDWINSVIGEDVSLREEYRQTYKPDWHGFRMPD